MKTLQEALNGNPVLKACLYVLASMLPVLIVALEGWSKEPPANGYVIAVVIGQSITQGIIALKTFMSDPKSKPTP